jgi:3',5'-cyclic-AMP phosphodiesterase
VAPTFPFTGPDPVEVFALEDTSAQLVWRGLPDGELGVIVDGREIRLGWAGGPGAADIGGLLPDRRYDIDITVDGRVVCQRRIRTEPRIEGPALCRIATISDLHLGETGFGLLKEMRESGRPERQYPLRCAIAAVREAVHWGAELLVIKGDITDLGAAPHWDLVDELLAEVPIPVMAIPGNHDTVEKPGSLDATTELRRRGLFPDAVQTLDLPGVRVVAADSTVAGHSWGRMRRHSNELARALDVPTPALVFSHHHFEERRHPSFWPLGTPHRDGVSALTAMIAANPDILVSTGHTHRNRVRRHQSAVITEVGSTKDHPGVWAGYVVHPSGVRQVVRRVAESSCIEWTERTRAVVGGIWGKWSPGTTDDRSVTHFWTRPTTLSADHHRLAAQDR